MSETNPQRQSFGERRAV